MLTCRRGIRCMHVASIFEAVPKDRPVTLAVLNEDGFHRLGLGKHERPVLERGDRQLDFVEMAPR